MVVVGGQVITAAVDQSNLDDNNTPDQCAPDPWAQGLGIFDLTEMQWKASYNATAEPYVTPDVVKTYYSKHGRYPATWTTPVVRDWFMKESMSQFQNAYHTHIALNNVPLQDLSLPTPHQLLTRAVTPAQSQVARSPAS